MKINLEQPVWLRRSALKRITVIEALPYFLNVRELNEERETFQ